ncbi:MAG TPA: DNA methyltransferase [Candidatus Limnocylindrales bacterium]|nr:DNA methyltransferase [Candidatus Limnocylindrales bacterium]
MIEYASRDGRRRLFAGDSRRLGPIASASVGVIVTSPPYWQRGRGLASAERYARQLALEFAPEWRRVLLPDGDLWIVIGDRHDGREWAGVDGLLTTWLRRAGFGLQAKGCWAQTRSREPWYDRINYVLRFRKAGRRAPPSRTTLCWMLPLPRSHRASLWDATPDPVIRCAIEESRRRGTVLDPFAGAGTVGLIATAMGRDWVGVEKDPRMAALAARRLRLRRVRGS